MKWIWYIIILAVLGGGGWWLWHVASKPPPGMKVAEMGREHVSEQEVAKTHYNSNPPTSGPHLPIWVKPGLYRQPQSEGELIHSLEHGYITISYNCGVHLGADGKNFFSLTPIVYAHEEGSASSDLASDKEATGSAINGSSACQTLIQQLEELAQRKKIFKLIVVPRPQLDTTIALSAWGHIDKFDMFEAQRIEAFIDYHRDHGPEQTME